MTTRISFSAWGIGNLRLPAYAMSNGICGSPDLVAQAIARKNRLCVCGGPRCDGSSGNTRIYQVTLGTPASGGGYSVVKQVWFSISYTPPSDADLKKSAMDDAAVREFYRDYDEKFFNCIE